MLPSTNLEANKWHPSLLVNGFNKCEYSRSDTHIQNGLDSAADLKLGYFPCQLLTPMSASFCPNDEGEGQYENTDEEEEDGNEKPEGL
ncbi:hypothetical protein E5288_WYG021869 [Bos mutus]|uniref:Uncharacterized protein n=1 Tax=Bos mutus TaxID=72004 RepID=A0A6B0SHS8_9CETA|nr:hypothetical protein [Bos mutus]